MPRIFVSENFLWLIIPPPHPRHRATTPPQPPTLPPLEQHLNLPKYIDSTNRIRPFLTFRHANNVVYITFPGPGDAKKLLVRGLENCSKWSSEESFGTHRLIVYDCRPNVHKPDHLSDSSLRRRRRWQHPQFTHPHATHEEKGWVGMVRPKLRRHNAVWPKWRCHFINARVEHSNITQWRLLFILNASSNSMCGCGRRGCVLSDSQPLTSFPAVAPHR